MAKVIAFAEAPFPRVLTELKQHSCKNTIANRESYTRTYN